MPSRARKSWLLLFVLLTLPVALLGADFKELRKELRKRLAGQDEPGAIAAVKDLAQLGGEEVIEELYTIGLMAGTTPTFYDAVVQALAGLDGAMEFLVEKYDDIERKPDFQERVYVADIVGNIQGEESRALQIRMLEDRSDFVQVVAVRALEKSLHRDAIEPLLKLLESLRKDKARGVLINQVEDSLFVLTGQEYESMEDWWSWWEPKKEIFDPKQTDTGGATGLARKRRKKDAEFFGVPIDSKHVVFVIDTSGSMRFIEKRDIPGLAEVTGGSDKGGEVTKKGGQMSAEDRRLALFWSRMSMAKRELTKVIERLDEDTWFNIVRFDSNASKFKKKAIIASRKNKISALKWVEALKFNQHGHTHTLEALMQAFAADGKTNTIFFLSDGRPSKDGNRDDPPRPILNQVFKENRFRKIKINTFGFDEVTYPKGQVSGELKAANDFLRELAKETGGKFTAMGVDPRRTPDNPNGE